MVKQQRRSRLQPQQCLGEALDKEVSALELKLAASEVERERLTGEVWQAQSRCRDLEELASTQLAQAYEHRKFAEEAHGHGEELRNQLAIVTQQLSLTQQQYYNANQSLEQARYQDTQLRSKLSEAQATISYLEAEKEHLTLKVGELEKQKEDQERHHSLELADLHRQLSELQDRHSTAEARATNAEQMRSSFEKQSDEHFRRYETETGGRLQDLEAKFRERNDLVQSLREAVRTYQALTEELQASHIESTMDFAKTLAGLRKILPTPPLGGPKLAQQDLANSFEEDAQRAKQLEELAKKMNKSLKGLCGCGAMWSGNCKTLQARCETTEANRTHLESELSRHRSVLEKKKEGRVQKLRMHYSSNISRQVAAALAGIEVEKLTMKGKREPRMLQLWTNPKSKATGCEAMVLRWAKKPFKSYAKDSCFSLSRVVFIGYGSAARAWALFDDVKPEHCFSVFTFARSFDFICKSAADAEAFVVTLSRFCRYAQGWRIAGALESKNCFQAACGWSKLQVAARRKGPKLTGRLLDGLAKAYLHQKGKSLAGVGGAVGGGGGGGASASLSPHENSFHLSLLSVGQVPVAQPFPPVPPGGSTAPSPSVSAAAAARPPSLPSAGEMVHLPYGSSEASPGLGLGLGRATAPGASGASGWEAAGMQPYISATSGAASLDMSEAAALLGAASPVSNPPALAGAVLQGSLPSSPLPPEMRGPPAAAGPAAAAAGPAAAGAVPGAGAGRREVSPSPNLNLNLNLEELEHESSEAHARLLLDPGLDSELPADLGLSAGLGSVSIGTGSAAGGSAAGGAGGAGGRRPAAAGTEAVVEQAQTRPSPAPADRAAERERLEKDQTAGPSASLREGSSSGAEPPAIRRGRQASASKDRIERSERSDQHTEEEIIAEQLAFQQEVSSFARAPSTLGAAGSFDDGASSPRRTPGSFSAQPSISLAPSASFDEAGASSPRRGPSSLVSGGLAAVRRGRTGSKHRSQPKPYD